MACSDDTAPLPTATLPAPPPSVGKGSVAAAPAAQPTPVLASSQNGFPFDCTSTKVFCFGLAQEPVGILQGWFDPANLVDRPSLQIVRQVYETLFEYQSPAMITQPGSLLKYVPQVSADGLTYRFRIAKGLRFSNDTLLDVAAIKFNFDRWSDPGNLYHHGDFQTWGKYFGGFPGKLVSVETEPENNVLTINLRQPMADLYQILAMPQFSIVAPSAFNPKTGLMERTIGSNLYELQGKPIHGETKYVAMQANKLHNVERYGPDDPTAPIVHTPTAVAVVLKPSQDGLDELRRGTVAATDKIKPEQIAAARQDKTVTLLERPSLNLAFLGMNLLRPPFNNLVIRQAFAAAIDTDSLVKNTYFGLGQLASDLLPPSVVGRPPPNDPYSYDPDRARRQLEIYGYNQTNPLRIDLWLLPTPRAYYPDPGKVANAIAADLAKVNVIVTVRESDGWPKFYKDHLDGALDFYMYGWQGADGDPNEFLGEFYGNSPGEGGFENSTLADLLTKGLVQNDLKARTELYHAALGILNDQVPILPLAYTKGIVAVRPNLKGYSPNPTGIESWFNIELSAAK